MFHIFSEYGRKICVFSPARKIRVFSSSSSSLSPALQTSRDEDLFPFWGGSVFKESVLEPRREPEAAEWSPQERALGWQ